MFCFWKVFEGPEGRVPRVSLAQLQEPLVLQGALRLWLGRSQVWVAALIILCIQMSLTQYTELQYCIRAARIRVGS